MTGIEEECTCVKTNYVPHLEKKVQGHVAKLQVRWNVTLFSSTLVGPVYNIPDHINKQEHASMNI